METAFIVALIVAIPVVLFPAALVWYFNVGGVVSAVRAARKAKEAHKEVVTH